MNAQCDVTSGRGGAWAGSSFPRMCSCGRNKRWTVCARCGEVSPGKCSSEDARFMDDIRLQLLRSWVTKAANDLRAARIFGAVEDAPLDIANKRRKRR